MEFLHVFYFVVSRCPVFVSKVYVFVVVHGILYCFVILGIDVCPEGRADDIVVCFPDFEFKHVVD